MRPHRTAPLLLALLAAALCAHPRPAAAQESADEWLARCRQNQGDRPTHCEVRQVRLPATRALSVSGRPNGGIQAEGWERDEIRVVARLQARAETEAAARALASQVRIETAGGEVRAVGPDTRGRERSWSVGFDLSVPRRTDLSLQSLNGGIRVRDVQGRLDLATTNGGLELDAVGGEVRGRTTNGGLQVRLTGQRWEGSGLDLQTTNGGISLALPEGYSAHLVTGTVNGRVRTGFPLSVQGELGRRVEADLGRGGAPIRLTTTNGGIQLERR